MTRPLVGCTMGDPAGIGPEVVVRAAAETHDATWLLLGDPELLGARCHQLGLDLEPVEVESVDAAREGGGNADRHRLPVLRCGDGRFAGAAGRPDPTGGLAALAAIDRGATLAQEGDVDALVTAPVDKSLVALHAPGFRGHTEHLAARAGVDRPIMLFAGPPPHIALLTTHLPLATALTLVRTDRLLDTLRRLDREWSPRFGARPRIGVAALNPHAGERGRMGTEEARVLTPAIDAARADGIAATGLFPADSIFLQPDLDVVLALYHDQGTILAKRAPWPTVNLTLGLPYVRTSPDHGTAYGLASRPGTADVAPMRAAMELAATLANRAG